MSAQLRWPKQFHKPKYGLVILIFASLLVFPSFFYSSVWVGRGNSSEPLIHMNDFVVKINPDINALMIATDAHPTATVYPYSEHASPYEGFFAVITIPLQLESGVTGVNPTIYADGQLSFQNYNVEHDGKSYSMGVYENISLLNIVFYIFTVAGLTFVILLVPNRTSWKHWFG